MLPSTQPWPQGWEGQVGSPWGQSGSPAGCCSCPGLPATCLLSVGSCHWSLGQQGRRALGTVSRSSQGAFLEGTTSFSPVSGTHVRAGKPARSEPIRCLGSHPSAGQNPGAGSGWKEVGRGWAGTSGRSYSDHRAPRASSTKGSPQRPSRGGEPPEDETHHCSVAVLGENLLLLTV